MIPTQDIFTAFLIVLVVVLGLGLLRLELKLKRLLKGTKGKDLEEVIVSQTAALKKLETFEKESKSYFKNLERRVRRSTQAVETIRFNAFRGDGLGGNQSFATAFVDENGDGSVVSSLYSRERVSVFAKPVKEFESEIELSEEERRALSLAKTKLKE